MKDQNQPNLFLEQVISAIRAVVGTGSAPLHEPHFGGNEWLYLKECLDSTFVSSVGKFVDRFEADLVDFTGAKYAVAVVNGTAALHIALLLAGVKNGDEVLIPALTFVATANAVKYCGATPHFVDSDKGHFGLDAKKLRDYLNSHTEQKLGLCINKSTGKVIRVIVPMHVFGHPADLEGLLAVASDFNIALVEDAAESLGSYYQDQHTGTFGLMGALSFNGNKTITTGGGGAILTNDETIARRAKHLTTTAKLAHPWEFRHDEVAYNYRMPNINAALGCAQLEQLQSMLDVKRELFHRYEASFIGLDGVQLVAEPAACRSNYWLQTLLLDDGYAHYRDELLKSTNATGLMTRPVWRLMHELEQFKDCPRMDLMGAESLEKRLINIPSSANLAS
ncbi:LegC family aminotransferase [Polynucleobacter sphagniphilus]|uniref:LegC family aminotransferase n=1 Tax=Polynucleobacter sphagniphilus TaxID=1743169 RepID=UPI0024752FED|nr:LegC family aminotransferase [Polynucleobacter sphagniphilus]MDH6525568.1 perosamine synthetase [Polynucleobacter sphagniphilus]